MGLEVDSGNVKCNELCVKIVWIMNEVSTWRDGIGG